MNSLVFAHGGLVALAALAASIVRAWPLAVSLACGLLADGVFLFARGWPRTTLAALVGPAVVILAALLTFYAPKRITAALVAPFAAVAPYLVAEGPRLGSAGIAWVIVAAHLYAAIVGLVAISFGHERTPRLHARLVGLFVATSAPSAYGWTCRALGSSMRPAAILDCVFLAAIVVWSLAAWMTRPNISSLPPQPARCSGR